jgi:hypothetical protein
MGKASTLKLGQRGQDAHQEVPMRTPKQLYAEERLIYPPDLLTCLHCGALLVPWNSLAWDKTVQRLDRVVSVARRPGRCPHATCPGSRLRLLSAAAQRLAPPGSTYGDEVLGRLGGLRQHQRATSREMHPALSARRTISEAQVRYLYQHVSCPLLACHERQQRGWLAPGAQEQGGVILSLDGLAPQGGAPPIWGIRDLSTGLTLRRGGLAPRAQPTFEAFLAPRSTWSGQLWPCSATSKRVWCQPSPPSCPTAVLRSVRSLVCATWQSRAPQPRRPARGSDAKLCASREAPCAGRPPSGHPATRVS